MAKRVDSTIGAATLAAVALAACDNPQPPAACGTLPQQSVHVGETVSVVACFNDPNGDLLTFVAEPSNPGVAAASAAGNTVTVSGV